MLCYIVGFICCKLQGLGIRSELLKREGFLSLQYRSKLINMTAAIEVNLGWVRMTDWLRRWTVIQLLLE